jgi:uncharacterized protein YdaU (DUF1376 family)
LVAEFDCKSAPMNSYSHDIEAYQKKTAHLSMAEHGAYLLMLHIYYVTEKPLPTGKALYRVVRANSKAECAAVDVVVKQFWHESAGGLVNARADKVIAEYHSFIGRQSDKGKASAAKRRLNHGTNSGSTTVQPRLDSGTNSGSTGVPTGIQPIHNDRARQIPDPDSEDPRSSAVSPLKDQSPPDPRKLLWDLGVTLLGNDAKSVIGAAIKRVGEPKVGEILGKMAAKPPADPRPYFIKSTQERGVVV